jgi:hypothetical protein
VVGHSLEAKSLNIVHAKDLGPSLVELPIIAVDILHMDGLRAELPEDGFVEVAVERDPLKDGFPDYNSEEPNNFKHNLPHQVVVPNELISCLVCHA